MGTGKKKLLLVAVLAVLGAVHMLLIPGELRFFSFGALMLVTMIGAFIIGWTSPVEPGSVANSFGGDNHIELTARRTNYSACDDEPFRGVSFDDSSSINPANGLPMVGNLDIHGNAFGTDSSSMH